MFDLFYALCYNSSYALFLPVPILLQQRSFQNWHAHFLQKALVATLLQQVRGFSRMANGSFLSDQPLLRLQHCSVADVCDDFHSFTVSVCLNIKDNDLLQETSEKRDSK